MKKLVVGLVGAAVFAGCCTCECERETLVSNSGTTFVKDAMQKYIDSGELPGTIVVLYKDGVQEVSCLGYANVQAKRPISLDDHYMQCSQTKGFCGVSIAKLVEEGKISLDDPVSKYLPEFKELWISDGGAGDVRKLTKAKNVLTVRMCLNHTGGFPFELGNWIEMGGWSRRMPLRSVAATAAAEPIQFEPGTRQSYSNVGIDIGAAIVEVVSGMRWEDYLKKNVLDPLGMHDSGFWPCEKWLKTKIEMYDCQTNAPAVWRECSPSMARPYGDDRVFASAGAGLWTTARDQLKFYKMLMNLGVGDNGNRILKEETVKTILAVSTRPEKLGGYSLGLAAPEPSKDGENEWFGHGGAWGTNCMVNWRKKQLKMTVVQLCGMPRPWWGAQDEATKKFFKANIDETAAKAYTGRMK